MLLQYRGTKSRSSLEAAAPTLGDESSTPVLVLPSSTELFYFYAQVLDQCSDLFTGQPLFPPFRGHKDIVRTVCFFPDGRHFATGSYDGAIRIWTLDTTPNDTNWELRDDNWIVDKNGELMMWIPTDLHARLYSHRCTSILKRSYCLKLKLGNE